MRYVVSLAVDGRIDITVHAPDTKTAKTIAEKKFMNADIGDIEVIDVCPVNATDENNNITDY